MWPRLFVPLLGRTLIPLLFPVRTAWFTSGISWRNPNPFRYWRNSELNKSLLVATSVQRGSICLFPPELEQFTSTRSRLMSGSLHYSSQRSRKASRPSTCRYSPLTPSTLLLWMKILGSLYSASERRNGSLQEKWGSIMLQLGQFPSGNRLMSEVKSNLDFFPFPKTWRWDSTKFYLWKKTIKVTTNILDSNSSQFSQYNKNVSQLLASGILSICIRKMSFWRSMNITKLNFGAWSRITWRSVRRHA